MLNLRHPSLGNGLFTASMAEKTYPNLTFVEPEYYLSRTELAPSWKLAPLQPGRSREMYHYLETGTSQSTPFNLLVLVFLVVHTIHQKSRKSNKQ